MTFMHRTSQMALRFLTFVSLQLLKAAAGDTIDPQIYARLFINNRPMFDHLANKVLADLSDGTTSASVLDLATGPGEPSVTLATLDAKSGSPKIAQIMTTDMQPGMIEKAKARAEAAGVSKDIMSFDTASGDDLSKFPDNSFEAVTMSFGLMFVPDKQKCLREISRVLRPGGHAYLSVWKELPMQSIARAGVEEAAGKERLPLPPFQLNPLAMEAENAVESLAEAASLKVEKSERLTYSFTMGTVKETLDGLKIMAGGSLKLLAAEHGLTDAEKSFDAILEREIKSRGWMDAEGHVEIPGNSPQVLTLRKPTDPRARSVSEDL